MVGVINTPPAGVLEQAVRPCTIPQIAQFHTEFEGHLTKTQTGNKTGGYFQPVTLDGLRFQMSKTVPTSQKTRRRSIKNITPASAVCRNCGNRFSLLPSHGTDKYTTWVKCTMLNWNSYSTGLCSFCSTFTQSLRPGGLRTVPQGDSEWRQFREVVSAECVRDVTQRHWGKGRSA